MQKVIKRMLALACAVCACLSTGGCGPQNKEPSAAPQTSSSSPAAPSGSATSASSEAAPDYPAAWADGGIFSAEYARSYEMLSRMTLEEKVGQMLLVRCPETDGAAVAAEYHLGGYVLFGRDFKDRTREEVIAAIQGYQADAKIPLAIAVDEEGGDVVRVSSNGNLAPAPFPAMQDVYRDGGLDGLVADAREKAALLSGLGINLNLAPVSDITENTGAYIYRRTMGASAEETAAGVRAIVEATAETPVSGCLKHFPGYGDNVNTHTGIAVDERPLESFWENDFIPIEAGIEAGVECVLVSHNIMNYVDDEHPASISASVHELLRGGLGFTGVVMTDDMAMDAISLYGSDPYLLAVNAGNNFILTTDYKTAYETILAGVEEGSVAEDTIDRAVFRILAWKYAKGIL